MRIVLLGFMGAGKSTLGPLVAERSALDFYDLDAEIERRDGRDVRGIFSDEGEVYFRRLEGEVLAELLGADNHVLATGGGVVESEENRAVIADAHVVYLSWDWPLLLVRLRRDGSGRRPLLDMDDAALRELWERRDVLYRDCAAQVLELDEADARAPRHGRLEELADEILAAAGGRSCG